ncbi:alpha/beta fold hydrolase [Nesterenkonia salmonea]|nr:alpha/beta hydrolase [Nesterenkonia salmonea]
MASMRRITQLSDIKMSYTDTGGTQPLVVLLHGWPQTSQCWARVIPDLAQHYRVVAPDLRGYGLTDKPRGGFDKKSMAQDIRELVNHLGYSSVRIVGHDRGARVAHRFALDHGEVLTHLTVLDIAPTLHMFRHGSMDTAHGYWHWLFHMKDDLPELLVGPHIDAYLRFFFERWTLQRGALEPVIGDYVEAFSQPGALRSGFDDYRATDIDLVHDAGDFDAGRTVDLPVQVLWGAQGLVGGKDVVEFWKPFAPNAFGEPISDCGHFIPEEQPEILLDKLKHHLAA